MYPSLDFFKFFFGDLNKYMQQPCHCVKSQTGRRKSPVNNAQKIPSAIINCAVSNFCILVKGTYLNNILKVPTCGVWAFWERGSGGLEVGHFFRFLLILEKNNISRHNTYIFEEDTILYKIHLFNLSCLFLWGSAILLTFPKLTFLKNFL